MKKQILYASMVLSLTAIPAFTSAQPAPAPAVQAAKPFSVDTTIEDLLANPAAKAVVEKHFPGVTTSDSIQMVASLPLRRLQQFKPDVFTEKALAEADAELAKLPAK